MYNTCILLFSNLKTTLTYTVDLYYKSVFFYMTAEKVVPEHSVKLVPQFLHMCPALDRRRVGHIVTTRQNDILHQPPPPSPP